MTKLAILFLAGLVGMSAADFPEAEIANQQINARIYLPDAQNGFYKAVRFDWSGVISSLEFAGHNFYGPWFTRSDPAVRDFVFKDSDIVVGAASGMTGPAEEFQKPLGYDSVKSGGTFVKVGVGVLRKTDDTAYCGLYSRFCAPRQTFMPFPSRSTSSIPVSGQSGKGATSSRLPRN